MAAVIRITISRQAHAAIASTLQPDRDVEHEIAPDRVRERIWPA
jgi:hypothetical protein